MSSNSDNIVPPVLLLYRGASGVTLEKDQLYTAQFPPGIIN